MVNTPKYIVIHCTDASYKTIPDQFSACNSWHKDRNFPLSSLGYYIGYHRLITGEKNYQARLDTDEGAHCNEGYDGVKIYAPGTKPTGVLSMNFQSLGICIGMDGDIEKPTAMQYALLQKQVWEWQDQYNISNNCVFFHRHFSTSKSCPGSLLNDSWLNTLLTRPMPIINMPTKPPEAMCTAQEKIIADQAQKIAWYEQLVSSLKNLLNIK